MELSIWEASFRVLLALVLGGVIGYNREVLRKPAGISTIALVSLGSALFAIIGQNVLELYGPAARSFDIFKMLEGVIVGLGFVGAGSIIKHEEHVVGLTTAATTWAAGAVGLAIGLGLYPLGVIASLVILLVLGVINRYKGKWFPLSRTLFSDHREGDYSQTKDNQDVG